MKASRVLGWCGRDIDDTISAVSLLYNSKSTSTTPPTLFQEFIQVLEWQGLDHKLKLVESKQTGITDRCSFRDNRFYKLGDDVSLLFSHDVYSDYVRWLNLYINRDARGTHLCRNVMELVFKCSDISLCPILLYPLPYVSTKDNPDLLNGIGLGNVYDRSAEGKANLRDKYLHIEPSLQPIKWPDGTDGMLKYTPKSLRKSREE
jgi:hypothetical protein